MSVIRNSITKVKKANIELVKSALKAHPESTKAQIAELTDVSVVTCSKILNELQATGEVLEGAHINLGCGRPAITYRYNASFESIACLFLWSDCGQLELVCKIADLVGQTIYSEMQPLDFVSIDTLEQAVRALLQRDSSIHTVVIGVPGTISQGVISCSYLLPLNGIPLQKRLSESFPRVQIIVENVARAAAYGYCVTAQTPAEAPICYCFIPASVCTGRAPHEILARETLPKDCSVFDRPLQIDVGLAQNCTILRGFSGFAGSLGSLLPPEPYEDIPAETLAGLFQMLVPVLNPAVIAVAGSGITADKLAEVRALCDKQFAIEHLPQLIYRQDCRMDFAHGLTLIGLQARSE